MKIRTDCSGSIFQKELTYRFTASKALNSAARQLNERPRKMLDYESTAEQLNKKCVASIG
jgi:IS30 family transposase